MPDECEGSFKNKAPIFLFILNVILVIMIGAVGFMARGLYTQVRAYPNTEIRQDVESLSSRVQEKASLGQVEVLTQELRSQYDRLCKQMDRQSEKLDEINIYLRNRGNK